ncbi:MAG TPA: GNAT family N-acetyltransferase [Deinococcales bacterium]|nr:GNAT family N-acetyltransferase [Deinococcales bacterium]
MLVVEWTPDSSGWNALWELIDAVGQRAWAEDAAEWHLASRFLVAEEGGAPLGFLRWVVQAVGSEDGGEPFRLDGKVLLEAKVLAFAVAPEARRRGTGRQLQEHLIDLGWRESLYQVRSHTSGESQANHALKLSLGFALHPVKRGSDERGAYFLLPLGGRST